MHRYDGPEAYERFKTKVLPPESAMLLENFWLPHFRHNSLGALKALIDNEAPFVPREDAITDHLYKVAQWDVHMYDEHRPDEKINETAQGANLKSEFSRSA